ncbi:hypothetical protein [Amycolatopsis japonica]
MPPRRFRSAGEPNPPDAVAPCEARWDKGVGNTAISKALNLDEKTVRRYARAETADEANLARILGRCPVLRVVDEFGGMLSKDFDLLRRRMLAGN